MLGSIVTTIVLMAAPAGAQSINPAASQGKSSQSGGSAANMAAAAAMMAACMATQPPNMALCMMGAMAGMQGGDDKDAAQQSGATQMATLTSGASTTNATGSTSTPITYQTSLAATGSTSAQSKTIAAGMQTLKTAGYTATPAGITSSDGSTIPAAAFSSSGSMIAAGLDPQQVKDAQKVVTQVNADATSKFGKMGALAEGTGAGGPSGATGDMQTASESSSRAPATFINPFAIDQNQKQQMTAGKTVEFAGEPIGVKGDDIFGMVHAAYARKTAGKHFIETDHDPELNKPLPKLPKLK